MSIKRYKKRYPKNVRRLATMMWTVLVFVLGLALGGLNIPQTCEANNDTVQPIHLADEQGVPTYTQEDLELLALVIYQEAGADYCSNDTRLKVGTVVMNRVADPRFPDTIRGVVLQRAQYGRLYWTGPKWPKRASKAAEKHAVARAYNCAELVLRGCRALPPDVVFQAEFRQGKGVVAHQDGIYFCR